MKRITAIIFGIATLIACSKVDSNQSNLSNDKNYVFKASIENTISKADISSNEVVWSEGDRVGLFVYKPTDWPDGGTTYLTLSSGAGSSEAEFNTWPSDYNNSGMYWDYVAFFPYQRISGEDGATTVQNTSFTKSSNTLSVEYSESYYCYTSGYSNIPLIADLSGGDTNPTTLNFKHIGGAVKVSLSDVPGAAKSIGMKVTGKGITGNFSVDPSKAGKDEGVVTASDTEDNGIWLNFPATSSNRNFDFYFPVPTLTSPSLSFEMYDQNGLKIWTKTASSQPSIGRAEVLTLSKAWEPVFDQIYLRGWINNADIEDNTIAFSSKGEISSYTFTSDSYLYLYAEGIVKAYIPSTSVDDADNAQCWKWDTWDKSTCPKLKIPAGTYKLSLTYNTDGSIQLKYTSL